MKYKMLETILDIDENLINKLGLADESEFELLGKVSVLKINEDIEGQYNIVSGDRLTFDGSKVTFYDKNLDRELVRNHFYIVLFLLHLIINAEKGIVSLHASAIQMGNKVILFLGPKESGKSTTALALNRGGYPFVANDYIELLLENGGTKVINVDLKESISFRKHSAYQLGILEYGSVKKSVNEIYKLPIKMLNYQDNYKEIVLCLPHLKNDHPLEVYELDGLEKKMNLFQQVSYFYRNIAVLMLEKGRLSNDMIPDELLINTTIHAELDCLFKKLNESTVFEFYGSPEDIANYLIEKSREE
ncbi:hypothetical protein [Lactococcus sp. KTH0-1S]|uniref:hypothetical protein n=1 Tax=Lactococcus sp. KTH0-1S TaxID=3438232 RepID=UPI00403C1DC4